MRKTLSRQTGDLLPEPVLAVRISRTAFSLVPDTLAPHESFRNPSPTPGQIMNAVVLALLMTGGIIVLVYFFLKIAMGLYDRFPHDNAQPDQTQGQFQSDDAVVQGTLYSTFTDTNPPDGSNEHSSHNHHHGHDAPATDHGTHSHHSGFGGDSGHHHSSDSPSFDSGSSHSSGGDSGGGGGDGGGGGGDSGGSGGGGD